MPILRPLLSIQRGVDDLSKRFTGVGWKGLPQELVDEILSYLLDDLGALKLLPDVQTPVWCNATSHSPRTRLFGSKTGLPETEAISAQ